MALNESATPLILDSENEPSYVDWPAILSGVVVSAAGLLLLTAVGSALGLASVSPWTTNPTGTTLGVAGAAWFAICALYAGGVGGYIVGRLRKPSDDAGPTERTYRDGLNGLIAWGLGSLLMAVIATSIVVGGVAKTAETASNVVGPVLTEAVKQSADKVPDALGYYVDRAVRSATAPASASSDVRPEITRLLVRSLSNGSLSNDDRSYLSKIIAQKAGISEADAKGRVD
jgi:hypothetical protein